MVTEKNRGSHNTSLSSLIHFSPTEVMLVNRIVLVPVPKCAYFPSIKYSKNSMWNEKIDSICKTVGEKYPEMKRHHVVPSLYDIFSSAGQNILKDVCDFILFWNDRSINDDRIKIFRWTVPVKVWCNRSGWLNGGRSECALAVDCKRVVGFLRIKSFSRSLS